MHLFLVLERMFWNIPDTNMVSETEKRAFVSDRTGNDMYIMQLRQASGSTMQVLRNVFE